MLNRRAAVGLLVCAALTGCGGSSGSTTSTAHQPSSTASSPISTATSSGPLVAPHRRHRHRKHPNPGTLPQTHQLPSATTRTFKREMRALWRGIRAGSLQTALRAFFPLGAYIQVKAIGDPAADYANRLVADYRLDIAAAHALLGRRPRLRSVRVPRGFAHWVAPQACYNRVGYWEVPNARIVYRDAAGVHSFGIASMISWRGVWYVVHLGAVSRAGGGGVIDDPSRGPGTSVPSSSC